MERKIIVFLIVATILGLGCGGSSPQEVSEEQEIYEAEEKEETPTVASSELLNQSQQVEVKKKDELKDYIKKKKETSPNKGKSCTSVFAEFEDFLRTFSSFKGNPSAEAQFFEELKLKYDDVILQECIRSEPHFENHLDSLSDLYL